MKYSRFVAEKMEDRNIALEVHSPRYTKRYVISTIYIYMRMCVIFLVVSFCKSLRHNRSKRRREEFRLCTSPERRRRAEHSFAKIPMHSTAGKLFRGETLCSVSKEKLSEFSIFRSERAGQSRPIIEFRQVGRRYSVKLKPGPPPRDIPRRLNIGNEALEPRRQLGVNLSELTNKDAPRISPRGFQTRRIRSEFFPACPFDR